MLNKLFTKLTTGMKGEIKAAKYLKRKGYEIVAKNVREKFGEIDIVAKDGDTYVFVEVKTRSGSEFGKGYEAVDSVKQSKIVKCARLYCQKHSINALCRFDVISIDSGEITHIENAF